VEEGERKRLNLLKTGKGVMKEKSRAFSVGVHEREADAGGME